jgi:hypothetical protein
MVVSYDDIISEFLRKITEYKFLNLPQSTRQEIVGGYMRDAVQQFSTKCREPVDAWNDEEGTLSMKNDIDEEEFIDIITDGMVYHWFKPLMYKQDLLELSLNTVDFSSYSPAELLKQVRSAYDQCKNYFTRRLRDYTYDHGDLTDLAL